VREESSKGKGRLERRAGFRVKILYQPMTILLEVNGTGLKQLLRTGPNDSAPFHPVLRSSCRPDLEGRTNNAVR